MQEWSEEIFAQAAGLSSRFAGNGSRSVTQRNAAWGLGSPDGRRGGISEVDAGELGNQSLRPWAGEPGAVSVLSAASLARSARCVCPFLPAPLSLGKQGFSPLASG